MKKLLYLPMFSIGLMLIGGCVDQTSDSPLGVELETIFLQKKNNGTNIIVTRRAPGPSSPGEIYAMNADGSGKVNLTKNPANDEGASWSQGKIVFSSNRGGTQEIYIMNDDGSDVRKVTTNTTTADNFPALSPNGKKIVFTRGNPPTLDIYAINTDGSGERNLTNDPVGTSNAFPRWSPNGKQILYNRSSGDGDADIFVMNADGSGKTNLTNSPGVHDYFASWSPNGKKIAFSSARGVPPRIYVMNADGSGDAQVSAGLGSDLAPAWSPDGKKIAFWNFGITDEPPAHIFQMDGDGSNTLQVTTDPVWYELPSWTNGNRNLTVDNIAPTASFTVFPAIGPVYVGFQFNASGSRDSVDDVSALLVRWDYENDGTWDTGFRTTKIALHRYATAGRKTVRLEVLNTSGLSDTATNQVWVTTEVTHTDTIIQSYSMTLENETPIDLDHGGTAPVMRIPKFDPTLGVFQSARLIIKGYLVSAMLQHAQGPFYVSTRSSGGYGVYLQPYGGLESLFSPLVARHEYDSELLEKWQDSIFDPYVESYRDAATTFIDIDRTFVATVDSSALLFVQDNPHPDFNHLGLRKRGRTWMRASKFMHSGFTVGSLFELSETPPTGGTQPGIGDLLKLVNFIVNQNTDGHSPLGYSHLHSAAIGQLSVTVKYVYVP